MDGVAANYLAHRGIFQTDIHTESYAMSNLTVYGAIENNGAKVICRICIEIDTVTLRPVHQEVPQPPAVAQLTVINGMW